MVTREDLTDKRLVGREPRVGNKVLCLELVVVIHRNPHIGLVSLSASVFCFTTKLFLKSKLTFLNKTNDNLAWGLEIMTV